MTKSSRYAGASHPSILKDLPKRAMRVRVRTRGRSPSKVSWNNESRQSGSGPASSPNTFTAPNATRGAIRPSSPETPGLCTGRCRLSRRPKVTWNGGNARSSPVLSPDAFMSSSVKRLVIRPRSLAPPPSSTRSTINRSSRTNTVRVTKRRDRGDHRHVSFEKCRPAAGATTSHAPTTPPLTSVTTPRESSASRFCDAPKMTSDGPAATASSRSYSPTKKRRINDSADTTASKETVHEAALLPKLTKKNYKISPSLAALSTFSEADLAAVPRFFVSRPGYGQIQWEGAVDVRGVNLDEVVVIEMREVSVYEDIPDDGIKPRVGEKLNAPAVITLEKVYPKGLGPGVAAAEDVVRKFIKKLEKISVKMGAEHLYYDKAGGIWTFKVPHFSRYGLVVSGSDEKDDGVQETVKENP